MAFSAPHYAKMFSRLYELKAAVPEPSHPDAYFQQFDERINESAHVRSQYLNVERALEALDEESWRDMLERAAPLTIKRHPIRGWQSPFDTLNESKAFAYLQSLGCSQIGFIRRGKEKTPDIRAVLNGRRVLCEVKTIDISADDYQPEYIAQLDAHLAARPLEAAELVFCPASNLFEWHFAMRSATVVEM